MALKRYIPGAILLMLVWTITIWAQNLTEQENAEPGSRAWKIAVGKAALGRQIEGYASAASVNVGETIKFYVNVRDGSPTFRIDIFRLGFYEGLGGRLMNTQLNLPAIEQPIPDADHTTGLAECAWTMPASGDYQWTPPANGRYTGVYVAKLTASSSQKQSYIPFIVRADDRQSPYLFQASVTTWQAYNYWPENLGANNWKSGKSLYAGPTRLTWAFLAETPSIGKYGLRTARPAVPREMRSGGPLLRISISPGANSQV